MPVSGALTQLAAQGPQNRYLTVDPQITFFKGTYKRHSMFSMVEVENTFSGATGAGRKLTATIARSGDLVAQCYFYTELGHIKYASDMVNDGFVNNSAYYTNSVGHAMIETVGIDIGGNTFDEHTGEFLEIWERLTSSSGKRLGQMVGYAETTGQLIEYGFQTQHLYVLLRFWFNRDYSEALPLIALQYHEAKLTVRTRALDKLIVRSGEANNPATLAMPGEISNMLILVNYIFLDTLERRMFAQQMHEYLIDQVQFTGAEPHTGSTSQAIRLQFNHPVKEIFGCASWTRPSPSCPTSPRWVMQTPLAVAAATTGSRQLLCSGAGNGGQAVAEPAGAAGGIVFDAIQSAQLQLNGHACTLEHPAIYFRTVWLMRWGVHVQLQKRKKIGLRQLCVLTRL